ncbi:MAG: hypothetical protein RL769_823, partial [Pseudomonadota bacterium]
IVNGKYLFQSRKPDFAYQVNNLKTQLFKSQATTRLEDIYSLHGSLSDPQEFYLIRKKPNADDNYPNIMLRKEFNGFFKISEFNSTSNKIFNLTSISLSSHTHSTTKKLPTTQQLNADITSAIYAFDPYALSDLKIQSLAEFSEYLEKIKEQFTNVVDVPEFVKEKVIDQFSKDLKENPNPEIPILGSSYIERVQFENLEICTFYREAKKYIESLPYSSEYKQKISEEFDELNKQICDDDRKQLDKKSILKNLSLAVENVNPFIVQQDYRSADQRSTGESDPLTPAPIKYQSVWHNLSINSEEKKRNISKRGTKVIPDKDQIEDYFINQKKGLSQLPDSSEIQQTHVENLAKKREQAIETLYFGFIGKALKDTKKTNSQFSFKDALLALKIAKYFGGVTNKLNDRGDGYETLELQEVNNFLNPSATNSWASALTVDSINEEKFNQLKKFSALYQKYAGEYFKSARDSQTNIRLTFFPDRFMNKLISHNGEEIVNKARVTTSKTYV